MWEEKEIYVADTRMQAPVYSKTLLGCKTELAWMDTNFLIVPKPSGGWRVKTFEKQKLPWEEERIRAGKNKAVPEAWLSSSDERIGSKKNTIGECSQNERQMKRAKSGEET